MSYHKKHEYILFRGGDLNGFKDIKAKESVEPGHASSSALESGISNFKSIFIMSKKCRKILLVAQNSPDKIFVVLGAPTGQP